MNVAVNGVDRKLVECRDRGRIATVSRAQCGHSLKSGTQCRRHLGSREQRRKESGSRGSVTACETIEATLEASGLDRHFGIRRQHREHWLRCFQQSCPLEQRRGAHCGDIVCKLARKPRILGGERRTRAIFRKNRSQLAFGAQPREYRVALGRLLLRLAPPCQRFHCKTRCVSGRQTPGEAVADQLRAVYFCGTREEPVPASAAGQIFEPFTSQRAHDRLAHVHLQERIDLRIEIFTGRHYEIATQPCGNEIIVDGIVFERCGVRQLHCTRSDALHRGHELPLNSGLFSSSRVARGERRGGLRRGSGSQGVVRNEKRQQRSKAR